MELIDLIIKVVIVEEGLGVCGMLIVSEFVEILDMYVGGDRNRIKIV